MSGDGEADVPGLVVQDRCPRCGAPPRFKLDAQYFCDSDGCHVLMWNPYDAPPRYTAGANAHRL